MQVMENEERCLLALCDIHRDETSPTIFFFHVSQLPLRILLCEMAVLCVMTSASPKDLPKSAVLTV